MFRLSSLSVVLPIAILTLDTAIIVAASGMAAAERDESKPFYLRDIQIGEYYTLPFSPVTVVTIIISFLLLSNIMASGPKSTATASHILLDGVDAETRLLKLKDSINGDYAKFMLMAKEHSKCPSGKSAGGSLGMFKPGMMVPAFDRAIFGGESKVGEVIGPIQTNFGWHLIWIEDRKLA